MIAAVHFRNFKALRSAAVRLEPFNLFIGPNGSGKTSLIQALLRLRTLAGLPVVHGHDLQGQKPAGPQIEFHFVPPFQNVRVTLGCTSDELVCNLLVVDHPPGIAGEGQWAELRTKLQGIRAYLFDHYAMAVPAKRSDGAELASNAGNLAAVLALRREQASVALKALEEDFCRILPEFGGLDFRDAGDGRVELVARLAGGDERIAADSLSQGTLYLLATLTLAHTPAPPTVVCLEEADRGVHPRMLREVRDALYRLSYPKDAGMERVPVQVVTTTHSPYLLDLFKEHPDEVVLASKSGNAATFMRLSERTDLLDLMKETHLGDLWYSGILGGVPGE
ncbi:AAA family ATPase [Opitutus sp. GAS368]|jgi:predicted ATPase|uniref:AAA family ATPase n=1 Tax=Opitutus sp. GAS368 TaxID=1882749 RepID=UPI00087A1D13|nr:AAA family ATPase [Opitutus sp. GAS368]SDR65561.1 Predicted ATPase [Opitutus sp. GAS368]